MSIRYFLLYLTHELAVFSVLYFVEDPLHCSPLKIHSIVKTVLWKASWTFFFDSCFLFCLSTIKSDYSKYLDTWHVNCDAGSVLQAKWQVWQARPSVTCNVVFNLALGICTASKHQETVIIHPDKAGPVEVHTWSFNE